MQLEHSIQDKEFFNLGEKLVQEEQDVERFVAKSQRNLKEKENRNMPKYIVSKGHYQTYFLAATSQVRK